MKFGVHNPSWLFGHDPAEAFEAVTAKGEMGRSPRAAKPSYSLEYG